MSSSRRSTTRRSRLARLLRRVDVRLTLWFSAIMLVGALLLFAFTFLTLFQTLQDENRQQLRGRALGYVVRYRTASSERAGINMLVNELSNEILTPAGSPFFARIATSRNDQVFLGIPLRDWQEIDLSPLVSGDDPHAEGFLTIDAEQFGYQLEVLGVRLSDNYVLQIGGDTRDRVTVLRAFQTSFFLIFAVMLGVSLAGGLILAGRTLRPIGALNATVRSIIETGDLDRRIPARNSNDDLDDMIDSVNLMLDRIQALVAGLRDALDAVAHDLRTPLTRLRSTAERALSQERALSSERALTRDSGTAGESAPGSGTGHAESRDAQVEHTYREALSDAMEESERILGMMDAMMDISEAESGAMRLRRQPVDLRRLAGEVADVYSVVAEDARMTIDVRSGAPLPVLVDPARLRQVIGNLYDNAVKYGEAGTTIDVDGAADGGQVHLAVRNDGTPIPAEELDRIWNRLYRGRGAGDRRDGLGLGLALVRAIVTAHGGQVEVESSPEAGTLFTISLPLAPDPANITDL